MFVNLMITVIKIAMDAVILADLNEKEITALMMMIITCMKSLHL